jgi:nitrogen fixation protein NifX
MKLRRLALVTNATSGGKAMKVAFATEDMQHVDAHFGWARNIVIYEVEPEGARLVEALRFEGDLEEDGNEDKLAPKLAAISDCAIVYVAAIGGSAAARVVNARVHPVKVPQPEAIATLLAKLVEVLNGTPPPWLRKALMKGRKPAMDYEQGEATHG